MIFLQFHFLNYFTYTAVSVHKHFYLILLITQRHSVGLSLCLTNQLTSKRT